MTGEPNLGKEEKFDLHQIKLIIDKDLGKNQNKGNDEAALEAKAKTETNIENLKEKHQEERFLWICCIIVFLDMFAFSHMASWAGPIVLGLIEILFLIVAGTYFGVDHIYTVVMKCVEKWNGQFRR